MTRLPRKPVYLKYLDPKYADEKEKYYGAYMRVKNFEARHGVGQTELNALNEQELAEILESMVKLYRDPALETNLGRAEREAQELLDSEVDDKIGHHAEELDNLIEQQDSVVARYAAIVERLNHRMQRELAPIRHRVGEIEVEIMSDLAGFGEDLELPDRLEPEVEGDETEPLFDAARGYFEQLDHYRLYQGRGELKLRSEL